MLRKMCHDLPELARQSLADLLPTSAEFIGFKMMLTPETQERHSLASRQYPWIPLERKD